ncbi:MAG TPA: hypothetical protein VLH16_04030, partial [Bacteroidales bacterium]|nr:hypothetical protein [Bacteroidales bacterium]
MISFLKSLFGTKAQSDLRELMPYLAKTVAAYETIKNLRNDDLRAKTSHFRQLISEHISDEESQIFQLRERIENEYDMDVDEKEQLYKEIDRLNNQSYAKTQEILNQILPEAFSIIKETARRFKESERVVATATDFDRDLATHKPYVEIQDDQAIYHNSWSAGGNRITWDMVHYDVQLIGGVALHQGKIAEMATGEGKTLVATLPVYLNALPAKGVHIVTVNDYLARRDSEWMGVLYEFHGLRVDCIDKHEPNSTNRKKA